MAAGRDTEATSSAVITTDGTIHSSDSGAVIEQLQSERQERAESVYLDKPSIAEATHPIVMEECGVLSYGSVGQKHCGVSLATPETEPASPPVSPLVASFSSKATPLGSHEAKAHSETCSKTETKEPTKTEDRRKADWLTSATIMVCYLLALCVSISHLIFFQHLNGLEVAKTVPQSYVSTISVIFVRLYSILLTIALSTGLMQTIWWIMRRRPLKLSTVDALSTITTRMASLTNTNAWQKASLVCIMALWLLCVPIATVFPPGSLVVVGEPVTQLTVKSVPIYNPELMVPNQGVGGEFGTLSFSDTLSPMAGLANANGTWLASSICAEWGEWVQLSGILSTGSSPCGQNCSYELRATMPALACTASSYIDKPGLLGPQAANASGISLEEFLNENFTYIAAEDYTYIPDNRGWTKSVRIEIQTSPPSSNETLSCLFYQNISTLLFNYTNGDQRVELVDGAGHVLNASLLDDFLPLANSSYYADWQAGLPGDIGPALAQLPPATLGALNTFGLLQSLYSGLSGWAAFVNGEYVDVGGDGNQLDPDAPNFIPGWDYANTYVKDLLFNTTITFFNNEANDNQTTNVTTINWENVYRFQHPTKFYIPYGTTLFVSIFILALNLWTLRENNFSADQGFLQVLCTTAATGNTIREIAVMSSEGGSETMSKELKDLEVMFGVLNGVDRNGKQVMGFGTPVEVKGSGEKSKTG